MGRKTEKAVQMNGHTPHVPVEGFHIPGGKLKEQAWNDLMAKIQTLEKNVPKRIPFYQTSRFIYSVAASVVILIGSYSAFHYTSQITVSCPCGEQMTVTLPDKSEVILNSETSISYNTLTWNISRKVRLNGEAFFQVQKGKRFDVLTHDATVSVLGTTFNVFSRNNEVRVNCFTGKVSVTNRTGNSRKVVLTPGTETLLSYGGEPTEPVSVDTSKTARWMQGEFYFNNEKIGRVFDEMERQYKINIEYKGDTNRFYTGYFNNRNLKQALEVVCMPMNMHFSRTDHKIEVTQ